MMDFRRLDGLTPAITTEKPYMAGQRYVKMSTKQDVNQTSGRPFDFLTTTGSLPIK